MAQQKACTVFNSRESKSFNLRVNNSATKHLSGDECVDVDVDIPAGAGFTCTAKYWPNWHSTGQIKIVVVITCTDEEHHQQQRHYKLLAAHIGLPARTGLTPPRVKPIFTAEDCKEVSLMAKRVDVEARCIVDDHFTAICTVTVSKVWPPLPLPTPSRLEHDILLTSDLTDVSFQIDGEIFKAHRLVLAARSPVFRAMLFGHQTPESTESQQQQGSSIAIQGIKASTFKSMLHYMYHGLLPAAAPVAPEEFQKLYVAADKYALDTLKQTCEEVLCGSVTTDTVLPILQFAQERACLKLKSRCLDFLAIGENFKAVAVTNEYIELMNKVPSLLDHVQNRFKRPRQS